MDRQRVVMGTTAAAIGGLNAAAAANCGAYGDVETLLTNRRAAAMASETGVNVCFPRLKSIIVGNPVSAPFSCRGRPLGCRRGRTTAAPGGTDRVREKAGAFA